MDEPDGWGRGDKIGAVLLAFLAIGLAVIAADILTGGRMFRTGCCADAETEATVEP